MLQSMDMDTIVRQAYAVNWVAGKYMAYLVWKALLDSDVGACMTALVYNHCLTFKQEVCRRYPSDISVYSRLALGFAYLAVSPTPNSIARRGLMNSSRRLQEPHLPRKISLLHEPICCRVHNPVRFVSIYPQLSVCSPRLRFNCISASQPHRSAGVSSSRHLFPVLVKLIPFTVVRHTPLHHLSQLTQNLPAVYFTCDGSRCTSRASQLSRRLFP